MEYIILLGHVLMKSEMLGNSNPDPVSNSMLVFCSPIKDAAATIRHMAGAIF